MSRRVQTMVVAAVLGLGLAVAGLALPVPFVTLVPGPVTDTLGTVGGRPLIQIKGTRTYPTSGKLELTTVEEHPKLNLVTAVRDWFATDSAVIPRELLQPPGTTQQQVQQQNTQEMLDSQDAATAAAMAQLKIKSSARYVVIGALSSGSPSAGKLAVGDRVVAIAGVPVTTSDQLRSLIGRVRPGQPVAVTYQRGSAPRRTVSIVTVPSPTDRATPIIGVVPTQKSTYPFTVTIGLKDVGGPSAGLMFAVGIVDRLTPGDLAGGRIIAGTGTIDQNGVVGPIGGIQQKLRGARESGAVVFLVPSGNCAEALQATPKGLRLVKIDSLSGALSALTALRSNPGARVASC
jgi:Lon-like protease